MPIIEWDESLVLGIQQFDEHHQHLVGLLNQAYDAFIAGAASDNVDTILDELVDYATYHFAAEEHWMLIQSYPKFAEHCAEHNKFTARVTEMMNDQHTDKKQLLLEVMTFLNSWLVKHIMHVDGEYGIYIATKGVPIQSG